MLNRDVILQPTTGARSKPASSAGLPWPAAPTGTKLGCSNPVAG